MKQEIDIHGNQWWVLSKEEIKLGFLAQCLERVSQALDSEYLNTFNRLDAADLIEGFILKHYDILHTQSIEHVVDDIITALKNREKS